MKVAVISPWYGNTAHLTAGFAQAVEGVDKVIIVDDGCDRETASVLRGMSSTWHYLKNDKNLGFAGACNAGYAAIKDTTLKHADVVCFLNSDVSGPPRRLSKALERQIPENALVGPALGQHWVLATPFAYLDGWCVAARTKTWEKLVLEGNTGPWDAASYPTPYWEDADLSLRAATLGIQIERRQWDFLQHKGGGTMGFAPKWGESFERNRATFATRAAEAWANLLAKMGHEAQP